MTEPQRRVAWTLLCPHHGVRAELELDLDGGRPVVHGCTGQAWSARRSCDQGCMRWFGRPGDETPALGDVS